MRFYLGELIETSNVSNKTNVYAEKTLEYAIY